MARAAFSSLLILLLALGPAAAPGGGADAGTTRQLRRLDARLRQLFFGKAVVAEARRWIGTPYRWGGKSGADGFDCSGYTKAVYEAIGIVLPDGAQAQWQWDGGVGVDRADLMPGDLLFFSGRGSPYHVGIYAGDGVFLQAPGTGQRVKETRLEGRWLGPRWIGARRVAPPPPTPIAPPASQKPLTTPHRENQP
jgi:hypothetical protein